MGGRHNLLRLGALVAVAAATLGGARTAGASTLPSGFQETTVFSGLTLPTAVRFSSDGRVFVAEKSGLIKVFDSMSDPTPTVFADLRTEVDDYWDRGLLGLALDPSFPSRPYVYALYAYDAPPGGTAPTWNDACATPPGPNTDGCVVQGRLVRLTASGDTGTNEQVLLQGWCQQFPSHSIGDLRFGPDGALYVSGGEGGAFHTVDYGQLGGSSGSPTVANPCGDPPGSTGTRLSSPTAEGGALRAQSVRRPAGQPVVLSGSILRVDPNTGAAFPGNPLASSSDANARRIVAYGFRNPFRFTLRPATTDLWVTDVGWNTWEEIDHDPSPTSGPMNFGWPCYEGNSPQPGYQSAGLSMCNSLYSAGTATPPFFTYNHGASVVSGDGCPTGGSSATGLAFYTGGSYPSSYAGALFFDDHTRGCIWVMRAGSNGLPDPHQVSLFVGGAASPVDLEIGPGGDLYYVYFEGGQVRRIQYAGSGNRPPNAVATASPTTGPTPLTVSFDGNASSDPDGDPITYAWDLDGDGAYDDSTAAKPSHTYSAAGTITARLKVTDSHGDSSISAPITITPGNTPPKPTIASPSSSLHWHVGQAISFSGSATDAEDGTLAPSRLDWTLILHHCFSSTNCHTHLIQTFHGVASATIGAPDHGYPSWLELQLTATDSSGLSATKSLRLDPQTVGLTLASTVGGTQLSLNSELLNAPFVRTVIVGSTNTISAPTPQVVAGSTYNFAAWSDGGAVTHTVVAPAAGTTYRASWTKVVTGTFGYTTKGLSTTAAAADAKVVSKYTARAGTVLRLTGFVNGLGQAIGSQKIRAVVYADAGGEPGRRIAVSNEVTISSGTVGKWFDFPLPSTFAVQAGTIWMGYITGATPGVILLRWSGLSNNSRSNANSYAAGASDPFGAGTPGRLRLSLYATYRT